MTYQKDQGCKKTYILNDKEVYGKGIAVQVQNIAKAQGLADRRQRRHLFACEQAVVHDRPHIRPAPAGCWPM